jgi:hypothetical protein
LTAGMIIEKKGVRRRYLRGSDTDRDNISYAVVLAPDLSARKTSKKSVT